MALTQVSTNGIADGAVTANDLENSGVTAGTYGSSSAIPAITVDAKGRVTSASTSSIDSTAITNGTSNVSVAASGDITATRAGSTRLTVNSSGIDVTGTVTCDGLTCDGAATIAADTGELILKDSNTSGSGTGITAVIRGANSDGAYRWWVGDTSTSNSNLYVYNQQNGAVIFATNNTDRCIIDSTGHVLPSANNAYDLGTSANQWRNGYFDGTVHCDGLSCVGSATIQASTGELNLQDSDNTGGDSTSQLRGLDSAGTVKWYVGDPDGNADFYVKNVQAGDTQIGANNTSYLFIQTDGHVRPATNNSQDLGTSSLRWRNIYTNDLNLSNEGGTNDVDGTWGSWTIQEGEDDLFLLNRRNGKKYKFNLSEVN